MLVSKSQPVHYLTAADIALISGLVLLWMEKDLHHNLA